MLSIKTLGSTILYLSSILQTTNAVVPLTLKGNRFIKPSTDSEYGSVFFINGVDYQPGGSSDYTYNMTSDVLTDPEICARDATVIQNLGANTIRIYTIDPDLNHDECMTIFNNAGIYVILDVNSPLGGQSLNRDDPSSTYGAYYMSRVFSVIESFRTYSNVIGFFIGNEVINDEKSAGLDPSYLRAVTRDARNYVQKRLENDDSAREVYIGYSAADVVKLRIPTFDYLTCAIDGNSSDTSSIDFFGLNSYEWCSGVNTWSSSGYSDVVSAFENSTVPVFFSEYGCNTNSPRTFDEVSEGIYDNKMIDTLSGGLVYEYSQEASNYGLVEIGDSDDSVTLLSDYFNFKNQLKKSDIPTINETDVVAISQSTCDAKSIEKLDDSFAANFTLPEVNKDTLWMIENGVDVNYPGKFVDVNQYLNVYVSGGSVASNLTSATFSVSSASGSASTTLYLTIDKSNLVNSVSTSTSSSKLSSTTTSTPTTTSSSTKAKSSSSTVSSISSSSKNDVARLEFDISRWSAGVFGLVLALL
ncbi:hypothetical protein C6P40_003158 [Pichia californica]|uniref:1,3-beta-glucanosyltransferase n=1 Tax=Pichia californica TaxID=460514 RepID=A0A9P6WNQ1_9ASCO|nr:hypothetical protein C6P40_003158 [[Candida] californica]